LRVNEANKTWRVIYRVDDDAILVLEIFEKKTRATAAAGDRELQTKIAPL
jgi:phage-related protein